MRKIKPIDKKFKKSIFTDCYRIVSLCKNRGYQVTINDAYIIYTDYCYGITEQSFEWLPLPENDDTLVDIILRNSEESDYEYSVDEAKKFISLMDSEKSTPEEVQSAYQKLAGMKFLTVDNAAYQAFLELKYTSWKLSNNKSL